MNWYDDCVEATEAYGGQNRTHMDAVAKRRGEALGDTRADPLVFRRAADIGERDHDKCGRATGASGRLGPGVRRGDGEDRRQGGHDGAGR